MNKFKLPMKATRVVLSVSLLVASTFVSAEGWYISASLSDSDPTSKAFDDGTNGAGTPKSKIKNDTRYGIAVGKAITPSFNLELEYTLASYDTDPTRTSGTGIRAPDMIGIDANLDADVLTLNASYDFNNNSKFTPFLKAGLGTNFYDIDGDLYVSSFGGDTFGGALPASFPYSGDGNEFTYFAGVGVAYDFSGTVALTLEYRFSDLGEVATDYDSAGDRIQTDLKTNDLRLGLTFQF